jgi:signal transduction histidine kinase
MESAGTSVEARATAKAERTTEDTALDAERRAADVQLGREREQHHRAVSSLLHHERGQTDKHLLLERARADSEVAQVLAELADAVRLRDEFLALASHELKTPLTPLALRLQSLSQEAASQPDSPLAHRVSSYISAANKQLKRLSRLIADLLDVSRMASGKVLLELAPVDLGAVIRNVAARYRLPAEQAGCLLEVEAPSITGRWDELRLEQTVTNLLENAIKYGPGKPIRVRLEATSGKARLTVRDEGIGIAPEHLSRIFERFERAVSERNYGGLGLGLYICRTIVEAMGGTIDVQSDPGRGSTFTVELPLSATEAAADDLREQPPQH